MAKYMEQAEKINWHDKVLEKTIFKLIPASVTPNDITIARFVMIPFVLWQLLLEHWPLALALFIITASTDMIDGSLARIRRQITEWGKIYDPLADKLLIGLVLVALVYKFTHPYLFIIIISLELILIAMTYLGIKYKVKRDIHANVWGKMKMVLQFIGVCFILFWLIFSIPYFITVAFYALVLSIFFAIISIVTYGI